MKVYFLTALTFFLSLSLYGQDLQILTPNGGEEFQEGTEVLVTWEGLSENDTVSIEFSSDRGKTWKVIADELTSTEFSWKIPNIQSDEYLIRIIHIESTSKEGEIEWEKSYGGSSDDRANSIQQTQDGGYIVAGYSRSEDGDITDPKGDSDYWILKLKSDGSKEWERSYGGSDYERANSIQQTEDGGYIVGGYSRSEDGDITDPKGDFDYWILKLKADGELEWQRTYGGNDIDYVHSIKQTYDRGYIIAGNSKSEDGDITDPKGDYDYWILKLKENGELEWQRTYGGSKFERPNSIRQTNDSGYVIAGGSVSQQGDITDPNGNWDYWVLKLKPDGNKEWQKSFGDDTFEEARSIQQTLDGGYIIAGFVYSREIKTPNHRNGNYLIFKLKEDGSKEWEKSYGGSDDEKANSIQQTLDRGYIIAGYSVSQDGDITDPKGGGDYWVLKLKPDGSKEWQRSYGGSSIEYPTSIQQTRDGGYITTGYSLSQDGDITDPRGSKYGDYWIVKIAADKTFQSDTSDATFSIIASEPRIQNNDIYLGKVVIGETKDSIITAVLCNNGEAPLRVLGVEITKGNKSDFQISEGANEFTLNKGECQNFKFEFSPTEIDYREAYATIRTSIGDFKDTIWIKGVGIKSTSVESEKEQSDNLKLYPNFTSKESLIVFKSFKAGYVKLEVYNFLGSKVATIINGEIEPGRREITLDLSDFATGRYYIQLTTPTVTKTEILEVLN